MAIEYLSEACTEMRKLLRKAEAYPEQAQGYLREAALWGCDTLKAFSSDRELRAMVEESQTKQQKEASNPNLVSPVDDVRKSLEKFEEFLMREQEVMIAAGLDRISATGVVEHIRSYSALIRTNLRIEGYYPYIRSRDILFFEDDIYRRDEYKPYYPAETRYLSDFFDNTAQFSTLICTLADWDLKHREETHPELTARQVWHGVAEVTITAANAAVDAGVITVSLGSFPIPVFTAVSSVAGGKLLALSTRSLSLWTKYHQHRAERRKWDTSLSRILAGLEDLEARPEQEDESKGQAEKKESEEHGGQMWGVNQKDDKESQEQRWDEY